MIRPGTDGERNGGGVEVAWGAVSVVGVAVDAVVAAFCVCLEMHFAMELHISRMLGSQCTAKNLHTLISKALRSASSPHEYKVLSHSKTLKLVDPVCRILMSRSVLLVEASDFLQYA